MGQAASKAVPFLFVLFFTSITNGGTTINNELADKIAFYNNECDLIYDADDLSQFGNSQCQTYAQAGDPCHCIQPYYGSRITGSLSSSLISTAFFELTDNSMLDFTIQLSTTYILDESYLVMSIPQNTDSNANYNCNAAKSFVELYDLNTQSWYNITIDCLPRPVDSGTRSVVRVNGGPSGADKINQHTTDRLRFHIVWDSTTPSGNVYVQGLQLTYEKEDVSLEPTTDPTKDPTTQPTTQPTTEPSAHPTADPTNDPTAMPTLYPTRAPTYKYVRRQTKRIVGVDSYEIHSDNIIPLTKRDPNMTRYNYKLPDLNGKPGEERPYCATCILAWADIDAKIELVGCDEYNATKGTGTYNYSSGPEDPDSFYYCDNGTWVLKTTGRLADWQNTYGRVEIWEVGDNDVKWQQYELEFNWWESDCYWNDSTVEGGKRDCDLLKNTIQTNTTVPNYAAEFEFSMPKSWGDARNAPLIVVWFDILGVPYAIRPELGYKYTELALKEPTVGQNFGIDEVWINFQPAIICACILFACFLAVMLISCFVSGDRKKRKDYMIDTRNLKTLFKHTPDTLIIEKDSIKSRARFSCARHGPWLLVVLIARLMYMFIFTFTFFGLVFRAINQPHFDTLGQYDEFAFDRDAQLIALSQDIESFYANESSRMDFELEQKQKYCYDVYINETNTRYLTGYKFQTQYHEQQKEDIFNSVSVNTSALGKNILIQGNGKIGCSTNQGNGAIIWLNSRTTTISTAPYTVTSNLSNGTVIEQFFNGTVLNADGYDTEWSNFSFFENVINPYCEEQNWCVGWGFYNKNPNTSQDAYYVMFNEMADPSVEEDGPSGVCYGSAEAVSFDFLRFNSSEFDNYAETLQASYIEDFQSYASDLYDTLNGMWSALQDFDTNTNRGSSQYSNSFDSQYNLSSGAKYDVDIKYIDTKFGGNASSTGLTFDNYFDFYIGCPDCPAGNFTESVLQTVGNLFGNNSNFSTNLTDLPVNFSNLIAVDPEFIEFPEFPTIELPFDFPGWPDFGIVFGLTATLDIMLFVYRWYKTTGIVARIVRGKDVDVALSHLMVHKAAPTPCCVGRSMMDYLLNCVLWCYDKMSHCGYNLYKVFFWVWYLFQIAIVIIIILMAYWILSVLLTPDFIEGLGAFQLMTIGLGAQRSVRNQVTCTTALGYNEYTLFNMENNMASFARERNDDAYQRNEQERQSVSDYNSLLEINWRAYHSDSRDVTSQGTQGGWVNLNTTADNTQTYLVATQIDNGTYFTYDTATMNVVDLDNIFDGNGNTYWRPYPNNGTSASNGQDIVFDFVLSPIRMTADVSTGWDITQITLDWRFVFDSTVTPNDAITPIEFEIYIEDDNGVLTQISYGSTGNSFAPEATRGIRQTSENNLMIIGISEEVSTSRIQLRLLDVNKWGSEYFLNDIRFDGHAPESEVVVPFVQFLEWIFDGSLTDNENASSSVYVDDVKNQYVDNFGTYVELCPAVTPVHGLMYRGFSRREINIQLEDGHRPFILALRNIALSPFYLSVVLLGILFIAYLFAFIMEWFLMKLDLYRENPYAKVPLVTATCDYDTSLHELAPDACGTSTYMQQRESYMAPSMVDGSGTDLLTSNKEAIELNMMNDDLNRDTLRKKPDMGPGGGGSSNSYGHVNNNDSNSINDDNVQNDKQTRYFGTYLNKRITD